LAKRETLNAENTFTRFFFLAPGASAIQDPLAAFRALPARREETKMSDLDDDIAEYRELLAAGKYGLALEHLAGEMLDGLPTEEAQALIGQLLDEMVAVQEESSKKGPQGHFDADGFWVPDEGLPVDDDVLVRRAPRKAPATKRRRHLKLVGED
jgi:hypothetical protein